MGTGLANVSIQAYSKLSLIYSQNIMKQIIALTILSLFISTAQAGESSKESASALDSIVSSAGAMASKIDWSSLSWDDLAGIPYDNKADLVKWATAQVNQWKGPLMEASKKEGLNALSNLGSTGWQGYLKKAVEAIDGVKDSNPETYTASKEALAGAWAAFEKEAKKYLGKEE
jgi:hypothetical protein